MDAMDTLAGENRADSDDKALLAARVVELQKVADEAQREASRAAKKLAELEGYDSEFFVKLPAAALNDTDLSASGLRVLAKLIDMGDPVRGGAWPSMSTLARVCGLSRPTVINAVRLLEERGHLVKEKRRENDRQTSNFYHLAAFKGRPDYKGTAPKKADNSGSKPVSKGQKHSEAKTAWQRFQAAYKAHCAGKAGAFDSVDDRSRAVWGDKEFRGLMRSGRESDCMWQFLQKYKDPPPV